MKQVSFEEMSQQPNGVVFSVRSKERLKGPFIKKGNDPKFVAGDGYSPAIAVDNPGFTPNSTIIVNRDEDRRIEFFLWSDEDRAGYIRFLTP